MAAYAALLSLKFTINQIQQHPSPPISLHQQQLHSLTENLDFLQTFLEDYSKEEDELESRIADAAYAAEDVIESHIVDQIHGGFTSTHSEHSSCQLYEGLEKVIKEMDLIKKELMEIAVEKKMGAQHHQVMISTNSLVSIGPVRPVSMMQNNTMVDFGDILNDIMYKLTTQEYNLEIVPIVGMGGTGKTMLATNIYAHPLIVQHFDILASVTISQEYSVREILLRVLSEDSNEDEMSEEDHKLGERVYKKLWGRRYLIVMDDIWSIEAWDKVKTYFPNNSKGSKIMITTRNSNLAFQLSGFHDFQMKFLDDDKSWDLLCNIVFGKECCPIELEDIGKEIARNCRGLPLSIVVIGGLLTKSNMTREYWEYTLENLYSQINLESDEYCLQILRRSYKELPIHLKPCFLYMGVFPEDYEIYVPHLIKLWVVEGFLKPIENRSLEEVAKEYVKELIERNLILVHELRWNGKAKSCKIHDLLRDVCLREARKQRYFCVLRQHDLDITKDIKMERLSCIHDNTEEFHFYKMINALRSASLTRSLIMFIDGFIRIHPPYFTCRLLRVLSCFDYNGRCCKGTSDADAPFQQANLRYLSLDFLVETERSPTSWYLLWNLQTLDVCNYHTISGIAIAPSEIWKMCHLRHVKFSMIQLPNPPSGKVEFVLVNLQTLSWILNFKCSEEVVKRIPNIMKLKLRYQRFRMEEEGLRGFSLNNLCCLRNLTSLYLHFARSDHPDQETMQNLTLPHSLKKLCLRNTRLLWEDMTSKIGSLPLLQVLTLRSNSCIGSKWETVEGRFSRLKFLRIVSCPLECWASDGTHFPRLEHLVLEDLFNLEEIPLSIGDIPTLQSIKLIYCPKSAVASAERIKEEQLSYGNEDLQVLIEYCYPVQQEDGEKTKL